MAHLATNIAVAAPAERKKKLVARVNGLFGGVFDGACFTLSLSYYFGGVGENPSHRAVVVEGEYIDQRGDLDAGALYKKKKQKEQAEGQADPYKDFGKERSGVGRDDIAQLFENIREGVELHNSIRDIAMHLLKTGMDAGAAVNLLRGLMNTSNAPRDQRWKDRYDDIPRAVSSAEEKIEPDNNQEPLQKTKENEKRIIKALPVSITFGSAQWVETGEDLKSLPWKHGNVAWGLGVLNDWSKAEVKGYTDFDDVKARWNAFAKGNIDRLLGIAPEPQKPLLWYYVPKDPRKIPPRQWMHAKHYIRGHVVMTSAPGDYGKTSLLLCNAVEMVTNTGLIGPRPEGGPYRVAYWNAEDPDDEIDRRIAAICLHHGIDQNLLEDKLIIGGMLPMGTRLAWFEKGNVVFDEELIERVETHIKDFKIDVLICDPLIAFHSLPENDTAMEKLVKQGFGQLAVKHNCCIELAQHMRKSLAGQQAGELTGDDSRGSSTIKDAMRSLRVINRMSKTEADVVNIPDEERRVYLRVDRGKGNMLPPQKATWFHLKCVDLQNGDGLRPGDEVQVAETWCYPQVLDAVKPEDVMWLLDEVGKGDYRLNTQANDWVGYLLIRRLKLDPAGDEGVKKRITAVIKALLKKGVLGTEQRKDKNSIFRDYVVPGKMPENDAE